MGNWSAADIGDLTGQTFVITGANGGLGAEIARTVAAHGAAVILAVRNTATAEPVAAATGGRIEPLDLADLASVRDFAARVTEPIDVLVNNAGVMALPLRRTVDGFEMQFGTNHLGHFALTGLLLYQVRSRIVVVSSGAHFYPDKDNFDDPNFQQHRYARWPAYGQSKLANLIFARELQRRLQRAGSPLIAAAAHPGYASTGLQAHTESFMDGVMAVGNRLVAQSAAHGALPIIYAATAPQVRGGEFFGPRFGLWGATPVPSASSKRSKDAALGPKLWQASEDFTGVHYLDA